MSSSRSSKKSQTATPTAGPSWKRDTDGSDPSLEKSRISYRIRTTIESVRRKTTDTISSGPNDKRVHTTRHKEIRIRDGDTGYGFEKIFGKVLNDKIHTVLVEEPFIRYDQQFYHFTCFCQLLVNKCKNLRKIILYTGYGNFDHDQFMTEITQKLQQENNVNLQVFHDSTLHDRRVCFSNGWVVKIGRGLNYFKNRPWSNYKTDLNYAPCFKCTVDIYYVEDIALE